ncbi:MAG: hypothetical protein GC188_09795 [Alphaproteobacteria bacterium]|nr:hypothetical protein [Alphaproteobacteria bacterium]
MLLRLNDPVFYLLCALSAAAMIFLPLMMAGQNQSQRAQDIIDNGIEAGFDRLQTLVTGPGIVSTVRIGTQGGQSVIVVAENELGDPNITPSAGGFIPLSGQELEVVQGHVLRITFHVEAAPESEAEQIYVGAFQRGIGQNGWQLHALPDQNEPIILTMTPPQCDAEYAFFGVWPAALGEAGAIQLDRIRIEVLEPVGCGDQ